MNKQCKECNFARLSPCTHLVGTEREDALDHVSKKDGAGPSLRAVDGVTVDTNNELLGQAALFQCAL